MKKTMSLLFMLVLLCATLTGCMGTIFEVNINEDCSGTLVLSTGLTEQGIATLEQMSDGQKFEYETSFNYNGKTYYGEVQTQEFETINELTKLLSDNSEMDTESSNFIIEKDSEGNFIFTISNAKETINAEAMLPTDSESQNEMTEEDMKAFLEQFAIVLKFSFPYDVIQLSGPTDGITIENNLLTIEALKMSTDVNPDTVFKFKATKSAGSSSVTEDEETPVTPVVTAPTFTDVPEDKWYHKAVTALAQGGLVAGVGDNKFNPEGTLTIAQFCQILARAKNRATGTDENGYWAGIAIYECVDMGYIISNGDITPENYNVPITREAAVAAMYLASQANFLNATPKGIKLEDIPDNAQISEVYKEHIVDAYNFGITNGNDDKLTFNPQGSLTRAQVCQLFYNLDWVRPAEI
ncbi:MAG: S-layer homology domain-containing protein [Clostridia bacterium]|nr:S-layer homology domain-containing protein [Clostridia bacterium]